MRNTSLLKQDLVFGVSLGAAYAVAGAMSVALMSPWLLGMTCVVSGFGIISGFAWHLPKAIHEATQYAERLKPGDKIRDALDSLIVKAGLKKNVDLYVQNSNDPLIAGAIGNNIIIDDDLELMLSNEEMNAVIAHELGHIVEKDFLKVPFMPLPSLFSIVASGAGLYHSGQALLMQGQIDFQSVAKSAISLSAVFAVHALTQKALRACEHKADIHAVLLTGGPEEMISALEKIDNYYSRLSSDRSKDVPGGGIQNDPEREMLVNQLFSTHPSLKQRSAVVRAVKF